MNRNQILFYFHRFINLKQLWIRMIVTNELSVGRSHSSQKASVPIFGSHCKKRGNFSCIFCSVCLSRSDFVNIVALMKYLNLPSCFENLHYFCRFKTKHLTDFAFKVNIPFFCRRQQCEHKFCQFIK